MLSSDMGCQFRGDERGKRIFHSRNAALLEKEEEEEKEEHW